MSSIVVSAVEYPHSIIVLSRQSFEELDEASLVVDLIDVSLSGSDDEMLCRGNSP